MDANIFIIGLPSFEGILSKVSEAIEDSFFVKRMRVSEDIQEDDDDDDYVDDEDESFDGEYEPRKEDLRFGYGLEVDEPRCCDYSSRSRFLRDHKAYDDFVTAGLRCEELGIDKRNSIPVTRCKAIRKQVGDLPPFGIDLLGETQWWCDDFEW